MTKVSPSRLRVLVGMSGGVDSSVAAALLVQQGYEVVGGFIKNWSDTKDLWTGECGWRGERRDALRVAAKLGIPLLTFDFETSYRTRVLDRMFAEYEQGLTPNPDVLCNQEIKFGLFFEAAMRQGFDAVATGHYARVEKDEQGAAHLLKGLDPDKDQSYFLHRLSQTALARTIFPIGHLQKSEVRALASSLGLPTANKPDSQGICFIGKLDFHDFLRKKIPPTPGEIVTPDGTVVGRHDGLDGFTIGQRHGMGIARDRKAWYVAAKERATNRLIVVSDREDPLLWSVKADLCDVHWINGEPTGAGEAEGAAVEVAIRYRQVPSPARLVREPPLPHSLSLERRGRSERKFHKPDRPDGPDRLDGLTSPCRLFFSPPVWALAPGQSAVIYRGDECLGGGFLAEASAD